MIAAHLLEADLPQTKPLPIEFEGHISTIVCGAATNGGSWLGRFISILKSQIAEKPVGYLYVAVRILLMCENQWSVKNAAEFLPRAFAKARDDPAMEGWWHKQALEKPKKFSIIFHRPQEPLDL